MEIHTYIDNETLDEFMKELGYKRSMVSNDYATDDAAAEYMTRWQAEDLYINFNKMLKKEIAKNGRGN